MTVAATRSMVPSGHPISEGGSPGDRQKSWRQGQQQPLGESPEAVLGDCRLGDCVNQLRPP